MYKKINESCEDYKQLSAEKNTKIAQILEYKKKPRLGLLKIRLLMKLIVFESNLDEGALRPLIHYCVFKIKEFIFLLFINKCLIFLIMFFYVFCFAVE